MPTLMTVMTKNHEKHDDPQVQDALAKHVRVTQADHKKCGYSDGCPKCADLQAGHNRTNEPHTEACRLRIYGDFEAHDPVKWRAVNRQLQKEPEPPEADQAGVDLEGQHCDDQPLLESPADAERKYFDDLNYKPLDHSGAEHMDETADTDVEPIDWEAFPNFFDDGDDDSTMVDALIGAGVD